MSKYKYDAELFLTDIKAVFQGALNTKIDAINTEKSTLTAETNDDFAISRINSEAWYLNQLPRVWSYSQFVVWALTNSQLSTASSEVGAVQTISASVEVVIPDEGEEINQATIYKLLRYQRALQEIAIENSDMFRGYGKIKLDSLSPGFIDIDGKMLRMSGINLTVSFDV